ncbi:AIPR family protein [Rhodospira trueperi]|uniref:AIPR protein n=1 Tax=Rhodospira trueperi TaxID=69960 RepID=A0A1G6Z2F4_9PROT|nr:AIPR family protein [Rhodospira trueperi]SDD96924.1 AIPR protein [Rhodospira trueperi]
MGIVQIRQIRAHLEKNYIPHVDISDVLSKGKEEKEKASISRALAALSIAAEADVEPVAACKSVVDGYDDNGIDALYYSSGDKVLYICQAKWSANEDKTLEVGEVQKFVQGVKDLLNAHFGRFNKKVKDRRRSIDLAINEARKIALVVACSSKSDLSKHSRRIIDDAVNEVNDTGEIMSFTLFKQDNLYSIVSQGGRGSPINVDVTIFEWGCITEPFQAYYGQVAASDVASWGAKHGNKIFSKNIRSFLGGNTNVNSSIAQSLQNGPQYFWYLNNGITALSSTVIKKPAGGSSRTSKTFECIDFQIVNGAQTLGVLKEISATDSSSLDHARVPIKIISLENCPDNFAMDVTRATNTQNRVDARNFVALDPTHERLRNELLIDEIEYEFRQGEGEPRGKNQFGLVEATVALVCFQHDVTLCVQAKREIGKIWEDLDSPAYVSLFNDGLTGSKMWNVVKLLRIIEDIIRTKKADDIDHKTKQILTHGNRFIPHIVMQKLETSGVDDPSFSEKVDSCSISALTERVIDQTETTINADFPGAYIQTLFKNNKKCQDIKRSILRGKD